MLRNKGYSINDDVGAMEKPLLTSNMAGYNESSEEICISAPRTKLYKRRFFMLFLYGLSTMTNGFMWIQFSILTSIISCYYGANVQSINMTALIFNVMFIPCTLPAAWMMSVKGLRFTLIVGAAGNAIASCIQCFSLQPNSFYLIILCQIVGAIAQCATLSVPPFIAAVWFGPEEISRACAAAAWFNQLGNALGFLIPPLLVTDDCSDKSAIHSGLRFLALLVAVFNFLIFIVTVIWYQDKPKIPPSIAVANKEEYKDSTLKSSMKMMRDKNFVLLVIVNGLVLSVFFAISPMLNQMVVRIFPGKEVAAGWIGFETTVTGMIGAILSGYILDWSKNFRLWSIISNASSLMILIAYTAMASIKILWLHFIMFGLMGVIMMTYNTIGFQYAAEMTYPEPEGISGSILIGFLSLIGLAITLIASWLEQSFGDIYSNLFFCGCVGLSTFMSLFIKGEIKRAVQDKKSPSNQKLENAVSTNERTDSFSPFGDNTP